MSEAIRSPSREFMVRQAVLNAAARYSPASCRTRGVAGWLRQMDYLNARVYPMFQATELYVLTIEEFRKLVSRYGSAP